MSVALPIVENEPVRPHFAQGPRSLEAVSLLRLSVTDRCNFRCVYCMPEDGVPFHEKSDLLSADDLVAVARAAMDVGIGHLKITGGEPTVRRDLLQIVERLAALGPDDLSMTTNASTLTRLAQPLRDAGLDRLTVSWDSMRPDRLAAIGRGGARDGEATLEKIRSGLQAATDAGFEKTKINFVVMGGVNDDEVVDFARLTLAKPWTVRFIEFMPLGESSLIDDATDLRAFQVDGRVVRERIESSLGPLTPVQRQREAGVGPAEVYRLPDAPGRVGFITAMSQPFCETCNRLRLTATGELRSCLFDGGEVSVWPALRPHADAEALVDAMRRCVAMKPQVHSERGNRAMSQLGG